MLQWHHVQCCRRSGLPTYSENVLFNPRLQHPSHNDHAQMRKFDFPPWLPLLRRTLAKPLHPQHNSASSKSPDPMQTCLYPGLQAKRIVIIVMIPKDHLFWPYSVSKEIHAFYATSDPKSDYLCIQNKWPRPSNSEARKWLELETFEKLKEFCTSIDIEFRNYR